MTNASQHGTTPREARRVVTIPSRMQSGVAWVDVCIHNASSRGLMVATEIPPPQGSYVDIRRGSQVIIGRVVWRKGRFFGIRCQDRLDVDGLIAEPRLAGLPSAAKIRAESMADRRSSDRASSDATVARRLERSRQLSSAFQFGLLALGAAAASGILATEVYRLLASPFTQIAANLADAASPSVNSRRGRP